MKRAKVIAVFFHLFLGMSRIIVGLLSLALIAMRYLLGFIAIVFITVGDVVISLFIRVAKFLVNCFLKDFTVHQKQLEAFFGVHQCSICINDEEPKKGKVKFYQGRFIFTGFAHPACRDEVVNQEIARAFGNPRSLAGAMAGPALMKMRREIGFSFEGVSAILREGENPKDEEEIEDLFGNLAVMADFMPDDVADSIVTSYFQSQAFRPN